MSQTFSRKTFLSNTFAKEKSNDQYQKIFLTKCCAHEIMLNGTKVIFTCIFYFKYRHAIVSNNTRLYYYRHNSIAKKEIVKKRWKEKSKIRAYKISKLLLIKESCEMRKSNEIDFKLESSLFQNTYQNDQSEQRCLMIQENICQ